MAYYVQQLLCFQGEGIASSTDTGSTTHNEFRTLLLITHYCALRCSIRGVQGMGPLVADISISLLRYSDVIPADKAFYEAGMYARVSLCSDITKLTPKCGLKTLYLVLNGRVK